MKKIELSKHLSFCFGVQKSLELIDNIINSKQYKYVYMLGEIIHNKQVINDLKNKGIKIIKDVFNIPEIEKNGIVIIQSHGVSPIVYKNLKEKKINFIDSTCPLVKRIHKAIADLEKEGYYPIILGSKTHTEVIGISGYVKNKPIIISKKEEINKDLFRITNTINKINNTNNLNNINDINNINIINSNNTINNNYNNDNINKNGGEIKIIKKAGIVMQSTFFYDKVEEMVNEIKKYVPDVKVIDTICEPTKSRQKEISLKSKQFKSVVVIGSKNSSNTNKLYSIAKKNNKITFFITDENDALKIDFSKLFPLFLASGASAPMYLINNVKKTILKSSNSFLKFSSKYIPEIDNEINNIFEKKIKNINDFYNSSNSKHIPFSRHVPFSINIPFITKKNNSNTIELPEKKIEKILIELKNFCLRPGKRIRPLLVLWGFFTFGGNKKYLKEVLKLSALIEIMHAALLIHDDIIDQSDLRRGKKSLHILLHKLFEKYTYNKNIGRDIAIVAADVLYFLSFEIIYDLKIPLKYKNNLLHLFGNCYFLTGIGQTYDILFSKLKEFDISLLKKGYSFSNITNLLKTGYYTIYYPIIIGISLTPFYNAFNSKANLITTQYTDLDNDLHNNLYNNLQNELYNDLHNKLDNNLDNYLNKIKEFSLPAGIAFQLRDDVISIFENIEKTGKSNNSDIEESKITGLIEETLKSLDEKEAKRFKSIFFKENKSLNEINYIKNKIIESNALNKIKNNIKILFNYSKKNIDSFFQNSYLNDLNKNLNIYKDIFIDLIELLEEF